MFDSHPLALAIATVAAFLVANVYYAVFARQLAAARGDSSTDAGVAPWRVVAELVRTAVLVLVLAWLLDRTGSTGWTDGVRLAVVTWIGFPLMLWTGGAMLWENTSWRLAAVHGGEWLVKLSVVSVILGVLR